MEFIVLEEEIYTKQLIIQKNVYYKCLWLSATKKKKIKKKEGYFVWKIMGEDAWLRLENQGKISLIFKQITVGE